MLLLVMQLSASVEALFGSQGNIFGRGGYGDLQRSYNAWQSSVFIRGKGLYYTQTSKSSKTGMMMSKKGSSKNYYIKYYTPIPTHLRPSQPKPSSQQPSRAPVYRPTPSPVATPGTVQPSAVATEPTPLPTVSIVSGPPQVEITNAPGGEPSTSPLPAFVPTAVPAGTTAPNTVPVGTMAPTAVDTALPTPLDSMEPPQMNTNGPTTETTIDANLEPSDVPSSVPTVPMDGSTGSPSVPITPETTVPSTSGPQSLSPMPSLPRRTSPPIAAEGAVSASAFQLTYEFEGIPTAQDFATAEALTLTYLQTVFTDFFDLNVGVDMIEFIGFPLGEALSPARVGYQVTARFSQDSDPVPSTFELDGVIQTAMQQPQVQDLLDELQALPPSNPFSQTSDIIYFSSTSALSLSQEKPEDGTSAGPIKGPPRGYYDESPESRLSPAAIGCIVGLLVTVFIVAGVVYHRRKKARKNQRPSSMLSLTERATDETLKRNPIARLYYRLRNERRAKVRAKPLTRIERLRYREARSANFGSPSVPADV